MNRFTFLFSLSALLAACAVEEPTDGTECADGKCDGGKDRCYAEHRYNNGTCDTDCAQADADCFTIFADQAQAQSFFAGVEQTLAMQQLREPRALVPATDPRFQRMRTLLDRGWKSYKNVMPVNMIGSAPELVVIDDQEANAFVTRDSATNRAAWVVMVQTGAMTDQPDDALLGLVMHELTHATKLHVLPDVGKRMRIHYQVTPGKPEPLGYKQTDRKGPREAITAWRELGEVGGMYAYAELNGMPAPGGLLSTALSAALANGDPSKCQGVAMKAQPLNALIAAKTSPLTNMLELTTAADKTQLDQLTRALLTEARDVCLVGATIDIFDLIAAHYGVTRAMVEAEFAADDIAAVTGKHVIDQIVQLTSDRHRLMRELAARVKQTTGRDMTTLRYFSSEEQADDASVAVLHDMGLAADGVGTFFLNIMPAATRSLCEGLIANKTTPPYGDLVDEHHATCWRVAHVKQLAATKSSKQQAYAAPHDEIDDSGAGADYSEFLGHGLPAWHRPSDDLSSSLH